MSPETAIYEFLSETITDAENGDVLKDEPIYPTAYHPFETEAIRIGHCESDIVICGDIVKEINASVPIQILKKIDTDESNSYTEARERVWAVALEVAKKMYLAPGLNNRVCDFTLQKAFRGWAKINTVAHAVVILPVIINPE